MAGIKGTRVGYDEGKPSKDQRSGEKSTGGLAGVGGARAQKPVKGVTNAATDSASASAKTARPTMGGRTTGKPGSSC